MIANLCGNSYLPTTHTQGWSQWEAWYVANEGNCPSIPSIRAMDIIYYDATDYMQHPITDYPGYIGRWPPIGDFPCWFEGIYTFDYPAPGLSPNSWKANTPSP